MQRKILKTKVWGAFLALVSIIGAVVLFSATGKTSDAGVGARSVANAHGISKESISEKIGPAIQANQFPEVVDMPADGTKKKAHVEYGLDQFAQEQMEKLLRQYAPDYGAFVAMDAKTGKILALVSYSRSTKDNLTLRATFPAASIFKVVTASAAIDTNKAAANTVVPFNGANHTLYKKNVKDTRVNRWTRKMTMSEAFGKSVNVFFGKLGLFYVGPQSLKMYAERFLFNQPIRADIPVQIGHSKFSHEDPWSVVSAASGYTRENTMSPLHGALIAAAVANDGVMMEPYLIESLKDEDGLTLYRAEPRQASVVVEPRSAAELRVLFKQTVKTGTSRKAFRSTVRRSAFDDVEFGGKTGSLTGVDPQGKCDWFVGYARYQDQRIAVAALTVNEKKWKVKSSTLANLFFTRYLKELKTQDVARYR